MAARFVLKKTANGEFAFNLHAANGEPILQSETYKARASAENGIASVKTNAAHEERFERLLAKSGKPYFNLKATNGQVIGTSEMYSSVSARDKGIESVKANAPGARIDDET